VAQDPEVDITVNYEAEGNNYISITSEFVAYIEANLDGASVLLAADDPGIAALAAYIVTHQASMESALGDVQGWLSQVYDSLVSPVDGATTITARMEQIAATLVASLAAQSGIKLSAAASASQLAEVVDLLYDLQDVLLTSAFVADDQNSSQLAKLENIRSFLATSIVRLNSLIAGSTATVDELAAINALISTGFANTVDAVADVQVASAELLSQLVGLRNDFNDTFDTGQIYDYLSYYGYSLGFNGLLDADHVSYGSLTGASVLATSIEARAMNAKLAAVATDISLLGDLSADQVAELEAMNLSITKASLDLLAQMDAEHQAVTGFLGDLVNQSASNGSSIDDICECLDVLIEINSTLIIGVDVDNDGDYDDPDDKMPLELLLRIICDKIETNGEKLEEQLTQDEVSPPSPLVVPGISPDTLPTLPPVEPPDDDPVLPVPHVDQPSNPFETAFNGIGLGRMEAIVIPGQYGGVGDIDAMLASGPYATMRTVLTIALIMVLYIGCYNRCVVNVQT